MRPSLFVAAAILATTAAAHADTVFNASGTFNDGSVLSGTLTINTLQGSITATSLAVSGADNFTFLTVEGQSATRYPVEYFIGVRNAASTEDFNFDLRDGPGSSNPLIGYNGGPICDVANPCQYPANLYNLTTNTAGAYLISGSLSLAPPVAAATPEPSSLMLLGTGVLGLAGALKRRLVA